MADLQGSVPVFLPDRTEIGRAKIIANKEGLIAEIYIDGPVGEALGLQMGEDMIGLSIAYQDNNARDAVAFAAELEQAKEQNDEQ